MQCPQEHLKTIVYAKFGGQTKCIMRNSKIENKQPSILLLFKPAKKIACLVELCLNGCCKVAGLLLLNRKKGTSGLLLQDNESQTLDFGLKALEWPSDVSLPCFHIPSAFHGRTFTPTSR